jgi:hypothetical protein
LRLPLDEIETTFPGYSQENFKFMLAAILQSPEGVSERLGQANKVACWPADSRPDPDILTDSKSLKDERHSDAERLTMPE